MIGKLPLKHTLTGSRKFIVSKNKVNPHRKRSEIKSRAEPFSSTLKPVQNFFGQAAVNIGICGVIQICGNHNWVWGSR